MNGKFYINKFIRDDGVILALDGKELLLAADNELLVRADPETTAVDYTEADGGEMVHQRSAVSEQTINGLIVPRTTDYWTLYQRVVSFFKINHTYRIIYKRVNGEMFAVENAWITSGPQIPPQPREDYAVWSITFNVGNANWREYTERGGEEVFAHTVTLPLISASSGGELWDETGLVSDSIGEVWEAGEGGVKAVQITSTSLIYPVWIVMGPCTNPKLQNNTTDTNASYEGTVAEGQTLTVDFASGTAYLGTALVSRRVTGTITLLPGENMVGFSSDSGATQSCTISWNNVIS